MFMKGHRWQQDLESDRSRLGPWKHKDGFPQWWAAMMQKWCYEMTSCDNAQQSKDVQFIFMGSFHQKLCCFAHADRCATENEPCANPRSGFGRFVLNGRCSLVTRQKVWLAYLAYFPYAPCMVYLPQKSPSFVGKYTIHGAYGFGLGLQMFILRARDRQIQISKTIAAECHICIGTQRWLLKHHFFTLKCSSLWNLEPGHRQKAMAQIHWPTLDGLHTRNTIRSIWA